MLTAAKALSFASPGFSDRFVRARASLPRAHATHASVRAVRMPGPAVTSPEYMCVCVCVCVCLDVGVRACVYVCRDCQWSKLSPRPRPAEHSSNCWCATPNNYEMVALHRQVDNTQ